MDIKKITFLILLVTCTLLSSCNRKQDAVSSLRNFSKELTVSSFDYSDQDWENASERFERICEKLDRRKYSSAQSEEIEKLKARCAKILTERNIANEEEEAGGGASPTPVQTEDSPQENFQETEDASESNSTDLRLSLPLRYINITSPYGTREDCINGKQKEHNGIDLLSSQDNALAMMKGIVVSAGFNSVAGNFVTLGIVV